MQSTVPPAGALFACSAALLTLSACPTSVPPEFCRNGEDDDGDGQADCGDAECSARVHCREAFLLTGLGSEHYTWMDVSFGDESLAHSWRGDMDGDGLTDLGASGVSSDDLHSDPFLADSHVGVFLSTQRDGTGTYSFEDGAIIWSQPLNSYKPLSVTNDCDVDGDGLDDLVAIDSGAWVTSGPSVEPMLRVVLGGLNLAESTPAPALELPLPTEVFDHGSLVCLGDLDGDGRGDHALTAPGRPIHLLPAARLLGAASYESALSRLWDLDVDRVEPAGDLDGDGLDELVLIGEPWGGVELEGLEEWGLFSVLPGGPDLGSPRPGLTIIDDEVRPPVRVYARARDVADARLPSLSGNRPGIWPSALFADLDGDGTSELVTQMPVERSAEILDASRILPLDGDVVLEESDVLGGLWGYDPADPDRIWWRPTAEEAGDIDGDGHIDLLGWTTFGVAPGLVSEEYGLGGGHEQGRISGAAVWFGDGTFEAFDRLPDEPDLMIIGMKPQLTPNRDGRDTMDVVVLGDDQNLHVSPDWQLIETAGR